MSAKHKAEIKRIWCNRFMRFIAISLVLYMAAHPLFPQHSCHSETGSETEVTSLHGPTENTEHDIDLGSANFITEQNNNDEHSDSQNHECDCFCQCNHVLPTLSYVSLESPTIKNLSPLSKTNLFPTQFVPNLYHPPRSV